MKPFYASVSENGLSLIFRDTKTNQPLEEMQIIKPNSTHRSFIISTWCKSGAKLSRHWKITGQSPCLSFNEKAYLDGETALAERFWDSGFVVTTGDGFTILAWIAFTNGTLMHIYVAPGLRGAGVANSLVEHFLGKTYMVSKPWPLRSPLGHNITYNPYICANQQA